MNLIPKRHIDSAYERELQTLRERLLLMAGRVEAMIRDSALALERGDTHLAESTIGQDSHVNTDEVEIDELCLKILARRQPLASDLRTITLTLKMVTDLERISDLAVNISLNKRIDSVADHCLNGCCHRLDIRMGNKFPPVPQDDGSLTDIHRKI